MKTKEDVAFAIYKKDTLKAAIDLTYGPEVVTRIKNAKTYNEVTRIMATAREARFK